MTDTAPADHRYIQVARALRKDIVDGVYPVGSQLPTEHELCERFSVSRYTVREALRRLREDNLVSSRPRAGTLVVPRSASDSYDVMSINDLVAFATTARFAIESINMITVEDQTTNTSAVVDRTIALFEDIRGYALSVMESRALIQEALQRWKTQQQ